MNTDPRDQDYQEIRPVGEIPDATRGAWTALSDTEAEALSALPKGDRMTALRQMRGELSHNQRKQALKRRGLR